jgi:hypothetical protein
MHEDPRLDLIDSTATVSMVSRLTRRHRSSQFNCADPDGRFDRFGGDRLQLGAAGGASGRSSPHNKAGGNPRT